MLEVLVDRMLCGRAQFCLTLDQIWRILPHQRAPCLAEKLAARVGGLGFLRTLDGG